MMEEVKRYSDNSREEEEEEEIITTTTTREAVAEEESSSKQYYYHNNNNNNNINNNNNNNCPFSSPSLSFSSSPSTTNHTHHHDVINIPHQHQQNSWLGMNIHEHDHSPESHNSSSALGLLHQNIISTSNNNHHDVPPPSAASATPSALDFMDLSLGHTNKDVNVNVPSSSTTNQNQQQPSTTTTHEKEHMFDKVVTPSDVGKLNRLVIPKQHAEKYFPLDSTSNEKGLLLNFEDRNGKLWRFRYSYWNSSQSYVMTKGWSRFVKEKKLDAGDIVSFQRGVGELYRHRLYIDWRRRSNHHLINSNSPHDPHHHHSSSLFTPFFLPNHHPPHYSIRWGGANSRMYSPQQLPRHHDPLQHQQQQLNYSYNMYPFGGNHHNYNNYNHELSSGSGNSVYYMRSAVPTMPTEGVGGGGSSNLSPMIIDSVPIAHHHQHYQHQQHQQGGSSSGNITTTAAKRLRLFGVNMECGSNSRNEEDHEEPKCYSLMSTTSVAANMMTMANSSSSSLQHLRVQQNDQDTLSRGEEASMLFDLDPSLQYRQ